MHQSNPSVLYVNVCSIFDEHIGHVSMAIFCCHVQGRPPDLYVCMYVRICECMYVCTYPYVYVCMKEYHYLLLQTSYDSYALISRP